MFCAAGIACALFTVTIAGPLCYQCDHVTTPADCRKGVQCSDNQRCFTQKLMDYSNNTYYKLGCENEHVCQTIPAVSLIGKRDVIDHERNVIDHELHIPKSRQAIQMSLCLQCCSGDACNNKGGCDSGPGVLVPTKDPGTGMLIPTQKPVDGGWSDWNNWSQCSKSCGLNANQTRSRTCSNPPPHHQCASCQGSNTEVIQCQVPMCSIDGAWSEWGAWGGCSGSCGQGLNFRGRSCDNPAPQYSGTACTGLNFTMTVCDHHVQCPVDGQWTDWGAWSTCTHSCGRGGHHTKIRTCTDPAPAHGGQACVGTSTISFNCNQHSCPVDGQWSEWGTWSSCSHTCGHNGQQNRHRNCTNPAPAHGGHYCSGAISSTRACQSQPCPVDGQWSDWSQWSHCSHSCGPNGTTSRHRYCNSPAPAWHGAHCAGPTVYSKLCNVHHQCPTPADICRTHPNYHPVTVQDHETPRTLCLSLVDNRVSWQSARSQCQQMGGDLVTSTSSPVNLAISTFAHSLLHHGEHNFWIGLYGKSHHSGYHGWTWVDNSDFYYHHFHHIHDAQLNYNCGMSSTDRAWYPEPCSNQYPFVCEIKV